MNTVSSPTSAASPSRLITLQGGCNFRDLGGYATVDGRTTRWGLLFRSASLTHLTDEDHQRLATLGIQVICDLRRGDEAQAEPTHWPARVQRRQWSLDAETARAQQALDWSANGDGEAIVATMALHYRTMARWLQPHVQGIFRLLRDGEVPLVFHCAAGKDRTGFLASLLLQALGVPNETVLEDYLLTNEAGLQAFMQRHRKASVGIAAHTDPLERLPTLARQALLGAHPAYLAAAKAGIQAEHGSTMQYLRAATGFSDDDFAVLRNRLLSREGRQASSDGGR